VTMQGWVRTCLRRGRGGLQRLGCRHAHQRWQRSRHRERLQGREPRHSSEVDRGTDDRRQELPTGRTNGARVTEPCLTTWLDRLPCHSQIPPLEGSRDPRSSKELRPPWTAFWRRPKGETACILSGRSKSSDQQPKISSRSSTNWMPRCGSSPNVTREHTRLKSGCIQRLLCLSMKRHCRGREQRKNCRRLLTGMSTSAWGESQMVHTRTGLESTGQAGF
jgi:hypothetical protein